LGWPVWANRSPSALRIASGHCKPDEELMQTVALSGMNAAACSEEMTFAMADPNPIEQLKDNASYQALWNKAS
jgi:hypothetical protein